MRSERRRRPRRSSASVDAGRRRRVRRGRPGRLPLVGLLGQPLEVGADRLDSVGASSKARAHHWKASDFESSSLLADPARLGEELQSLLAPAQAPRRRRPGPSSIS